MQGRQLSWSQGMARDLIDRWRSSGLGREEFCRRAGVPVSSFDYWRRKISDADGAGMHVGRLSPTREDLVEVVVKGTAPTVEVSIEICIDDRVWVRVPSALGASFVVEVAEELRERRSC